MRCHKHPHSSNKSAEACYKKNISKRADKRLMQIINQPVDKKLVVKYSPPLVKVLSGIEVFYFYSAA